MTTPRVETVRNQLAASIRLLEILQAEINDLHVIAYDRYRASTDAVAVNGGTPDWALDNHGNPRARAALRDLSRAAVHVATHLAAASHDAIRVLRDADQPGPRTQRTIKAEEHADALIAQARRVERGDYAPVRREPQPGVDQTLRALRSDLDRLRRPWTQPDVVQQVANRCGLKESEARELLRWITRTTTAHANGGRKRKKGRKK